MPQVAQQELRSEGLLQAEEPAEQELAPIVLVLLDLLDSYFQQIIY